MSLVLVGMSIAEVNRADELASAAADLGASVAYLQQGDPALTDVLTGLADDGAPVITLVGVRTARPAPGHSWLRRIAAHWWRERGADRPEVLVAERLAEGPIGVDAEPIASLLAAVRPVTGREPGLTSPAWEDVPRHRHQVLVCRGPRCSAQGGPATLRALDEAITAHGLGDDDALVTLTGCQFPCNQAPVVSVQPDDVWYGSVDPADAARIVAEHLVGGVPVDGLRLPR